MRTIIVLLTLCILFGFVDNGASAEYKVKDYDQYKDSEMFKSYISAIGRGYFWANVELAMRKQKLLYCQPTIVVTGDNYLQILDDTIKEMRRKRPDLENVLVEPVLLLGLQKTFPCQK